MDHGLREMVADRLGAQQLRALRLTDRRWGRASVGPGRWYVERWLARVPVDVEGLVAGATVVTDELHREFLESLGDNADFVAGHLIVRLHRFGTAPT